MPQNAQGLGTTVAGDFCFLVNGFLLNTCRLPWPEKHPLLSIYSWIRGMVIMWEGRSLSSWRQAPILFISKIKPYHMVLNVCIFTPHCPKLNQQINTKFLKCQQTFAFDCMQSKTKNKNQTSSFCKMEITNLFIHMSKDEGWICVRAHQSLESIFSAMAQPRKCKVICYRVPLDME